MTVCPEPPPAGLDPLRLRAAFASFPSGVVAVAAEVDGQRVGIAASSFTSVSLDPPLVSVSMARSSTTWPRLRRAPRLGLSVLAGHHDAACRALAGPHPTRFEGLALTTSPRGAVTLDDALTRFECSVHTEVPAGDHVLVLLALHAFETTDDDASALVFWRRSLRALG